ncbi:HalOD1 output domain-containing protein [Halosimplex marinum]|uniref:HalOD1 output domain-containing protein n=1 Tax=Halosimplex marinum TaxID=3396620 RepID=UPI003F574933
MTNSFLQGPPPAPNITGGDWNATGKREALEYNPESDTYRVSFDSDDSVSMAVVSAVAVVSETEPMELPPLYSVCDPEELETVVQPAIHGPSNNDGHVRFTFNACTVTVHNYGIITVQPPEADNSDPEGEQKTE